MTEPGQTENISQQKKPEPPVVKKVSGVGKVAGSLLLGLSSLGIAGDKAPTPSNISPSVSDKTPVTQIDLSLNKPQIPQADISPAPVDLGTYPSRGPNVIISPEDNARNYKRMTERVPLSQKDLEAKNKLIEQMKQTNEAVNGDLTLLETDNVRLIYVSVAPEDFLAEIKTTDIESAKKEAEGLFSQWGISSQGICNLPLMYRISPDARDSFTKDTQFDPNPLACKLPNAN